MSNNISSVNKYRIVFKNDHPFSNGHQLYEHRLVYEEYHKCIILPWADIHHKNGIKDDNRIENLDLMSHADHLRMEKIGKTFSKEHRRNLSLAKRGRIVPREIVEKMRISLTGRKHSKETIEKIKQSVKKVKNRNKEYLV